MASQGLDQEAAAQAPHSQRAVHPSCHQPCAVRADREHLGVVLPCVVAPLLGPLREGPQLRHAPSAADEVALGGKGQAEQVSAVVDQTAVERARSGLPDRDRALQPGRHREALGVGRPAEVANVLLEAL